MRAYFAQDSDDFPSMSSSLMTILPGILVTLSVRISGFKGHADVYPFFQWS
jgi:hypothetical protein